MPEPAEQPVPAAAAAQPTESKPADKPAEAAGKPAEAAKPAGDDKAKPAEAAKPAEGQKPAEELKTLLDEASEEEVKLDKDGKPIVEDKKTVPEKYTFTLAEGQIIDEKALEAATPIFQKLGLSNEQAQELINLQLQLTKQNEEGHVKAFTQYVEDLKTEAKTYFGPKLPEVMRNVARARDTFMPKSADGKEHPLQEKLNISGLANDKDVLEFFDKVGRTISEGKFVDGKRSAPVKGAAGQTHEQASETVPLDKVYPSMARN